MPTRSSLLVLTTALTAGSCLAQEFRGTFSGTVTDSQRARIPQTRIVAIETRTGAGSETRSETSGAYTIPFLTPGEYQIAAETTGFKKFVRRGLTLGGGEHPVIDIRLEVGEVSESPTVTEEVPLIEPSSASVGQVITSREVESFPTNGRTPLMLVQLAMGVTSSVEPGVQVRPFDNNTPGSFSMGGGTSGANELLYNGAPNAGFTNQMVYTGGGTANVISRSGANQFRGSVYENFQHSKLAANSFYYNARGLDRPVYRYTQCGLTARAPIWIPRVFNGRNRVFWFFAFDGLNDSIPANSPRETGSPMNFATVPTPAERQGDVSALLKANKPGSDHTIYDPATGVVSGSRVARTPFPNNVIPQARLNPISLNPLRYHPLPNTTGRSDGFQNYVVNFVAANSYDNELGRLDVNLSDRNKLSIDARHSVRNSQADANFTPDQTAVLVKNGGSSVRVSRGITADDVFTPTSTAFGTISTQANAPRGVQLAARIVW